MAFADLERTVAGPHEAAGTEIFEDAAEEGLEVGVRGGLFAEGIEGGGLHLDQRVAGEGGEEADVGVADGTVVADAGEVVDNDRGSGVLAAHAVEVGKGFWTQEGADGEVFGCGGAPHGVEAGSVGTADDAEAADALGGERLHCLPWVGGVAIDDADATKDAGVFAHAVEHVGVVEAIEAHLNENDFGNAGGLGMGEEVGGGKAGRWVVALAGGAGVTNVVVGPKMNVGVGDGRHRAGPSILCGCLRDDWRILC